MLADELGLGTTELVALGHLYVDGTLPPGVLSEALRLTSGATTGVIDRLERAGLAERQHNPDDRRSVLIALTPAGVRTISWVYESADEAIGSAIDQLASRERISTADIKRFSMISNAVGLALSEMNVSAPSNMRATMEPPDMKAGGEEAGRHAG